MEGPGNGNFPRHFLGSSPKNPKKLMDLGVRIFPDIFGDQIPKPQKIFWDQAPKIQKKEGIWELEFFLEILWGPNPKDPKKWRHLGMGIFPGIL